MVDIINTSHFRLMKKLFSTFYTLLWFNIHKIYISAASILVYIVTNFQNTQSQSFGTFSIKFCEQNKNIQ